MLAIINNIVHNTNPLTCSTVFTPTTSLLPVSSSVIVGGIVSPGLVISDIELILTPSSLLFIYNYTKHKHY